MKKFIYMAAAALTTLVMSACSSEEFKGSNGVLPDVSLYADNFVVTVDQESNTVNCEFIPAPGVTPVWIADGEIFSAQYKATKFYRKKGDYVIECKVKSANGLSDGVITKNVTIEKTKMTGYAGLNVDNPNNLFKNAVITGPNFWFATAGWSQIADPAYTYKADKGEWTVEAGTAGPERWQGQMNWTTGIAVEAGQEYDFSVILTSNTDCPKGVHVKLCQNADGDPNVLFDKDVVLTANEPKVAFIGADERRPAEGISDLKVILDFGGCPEGTTITIDSFALIRHDLNDVEVPINEPDWVAIDSDANLFKNATITLNSTYWAYGDDWAGQSAPDVDINGSTITVVPTATSGWNEWQGQVHVSTGIKLQAGKNYDICVIMVPTQDLRACFKPHADGDDGAFLSEARHDLVANTDNKVFVAGAAGFDTDNLVITFDMPNFNAGEKLVIKNFILQEAK